jgi:hypothetical protein
MKEVTKVYKAIKQEVKDLASQIKETRSNLKDIQRTGSGAAWKEQMQLSYLQRDFRHKHIARCEMRGRTRDEIEKPSENNLPNEILIQRIKNEWTAKIEEAVRADQEGLAAVSTGSAVGSLSN